MTTPWPAPTATGPVSATVRVPGSKSWTNRWLVLAALADGPSTLRQPLVSRDSVAMLGALRALGATVDTGPGEGPEHAWTVTPPARLAGDLTIDCGQAGTVMRFVPPLAARADGPVTFDGHETARARPVGPVLDGLRQLGVEVDDGGRGTLPFTVHGAADLPGGRVELDASASSQFVSALLLSASALPDGLTLVHTGDSLPSLTHIDMTVDALRHVGVEVCRPDARTWRVEPGPVGAFAVDVEPDLSSAAPFLALAVATGGTARVPGWPDGTTQPGDRLREILPRLGATVTLTSGTLEVTGPAGRSARHGGACLPGLDLDLGDVGELTPVIAALAVLAEGPSRLRGIAHLRGHETDRLAAIVAQARLLGDEARETADGLEISPGPLRGAQLRSWHDHRMAMFAAVVGAVVPGVVLDDVATADKTYPGFDRAWDAAVATA